jgi:hypothetical protein
MATDTLWNRKNRANSIFRGVGYGLAVRVLLFVILKFAFAQTRATDLTLLGFEWII